MQKYIGCEFSYFDTGGELQLLVYTGKTSKNLKGLCCSHCGRVLTSCGNTFNDETGAEWIFGNECVKKVFGAGLVKS